MAEHSFELIVEGISLDEPVTIDHLSRVAPDATVAGDHRVTRIAFDRERASFGEALLSAIQDVESVTGVRVSRVEPDELVWASEIAKRTGRTRQSVTMLIKGQRGPGSFPQPVTHGRNPVWRWSDVAAWFTGWDGQDLEDRRRSSWIAAVNGILEARHSADHLSANDRRSLAALLVGAA